MTPFLSRSRTRVLMASCWILSLLAGLVLVYLSTAAKGKGPLVTDVVSFPSAQLCGHASPITYCTALLQREIHVVTIVRLVSVPAGLF